MGDNPSKQEQREGSSSYTSGSEEPNASELLAGLHTGPVHSLCRLDDTHLLSAGTDLNVLLYCWENHQCPARFSGPTKDISKVDYNPASKTVHAASRDRVIYQWKWPRDEKEEEESDGAAGSRSRSRIPPVTEPDKAMEGHTLGVTALASNRENEHYLCSGSRDNSVCLWDVSTGKPISSVQVPRNLVTELCWVEGEMAVLQASEDKSLRVWDLRSCSVVQHFRAKQHVQTCCAVSPDGSHFLSGSSGSSSTGAELTLWDRRRERKFLREFKGHTESVTSCMFYPHTVADSTLNMVLSTGADSTVRMWAEGSGDVFHSEYVPDAGPITSVLSPSDQLLACSTFKGGIFVWSVHVSATDHECSLRARAKY